MKPSAVLFLIFLLSTASSFAQKSGLINSGDLLKQGAALHDSSRYKQALQIYDQISRSDTNYVRSLYERALTCEADSQFTKAIDYSREGLALKEHREFEPDLYVIYGSTLTDMHQYDEAIKVFDRGIAKYPQTALLYFNKAIALTGLNRFADAEAMFQKTLLINPYLYSAHYWLAQAALQQGKLVPAFLSCVAYLLMCPEGRYFSPAINLLSQISKGTDEIMAFKNKRKEAPDANYQTMEEILLSKIALDKQYKPVIALDDIISRQIQVVFEKLEYDSQSKDFYIQYYVPYFKQVFKDGKFELLINSAFSNTNVAIIKDYNKKNKKAMDAFLTEAGTYFNLIRSTQTLNYNSRDTVTQRFIYENGKLVGKGQLIDNGKTLIGPWQFYYAAGNLKGTGFYSQAGEHTGEWHIYYNNGTPKSTERYTNGKLNGPQDYYYDNGNLSSHETELNGELDGPVTTYYYGGSKKMEATYKGGKKHGLEKVYYTNGNLKTAYTYTNGVINGPAKEFYKSGAVKEAGTYLDGKTEGPYKIQNEAGAASVEMTFVKDKVEGEWKAYYANGKLKEKRSYISSVENGPHQEFYDNGQLSETYNVKEGKPDGEDLYYGKTGKLYCTTTYNKGAINAIKYLDPAGKQLFASVIKDNLIDIITFTADGIKKAHLTYNQKGDITGADTLFYPSGKVSQIRQYSKGELNGLNVTYYLNGQKKSEINMTDGREDGYYQDYYLNGQVQSEGWVKAGEYEGQWLYHDMQGKLSSTSYYVDSDINGYREEFDPTGKKTLEQLYDTGLLKRMIQYDDNGKTIAVDSFPKGSGKYTLYYTSGKVHAQGSYINGSLSGAYKTLYFDGSIESSLYYKGGDLDSTSTIFYYGGAKYADRKYHYGDKTGKWTTYSEDGPVLSVSTYVNDMADGEKIYYNADGSKDFVMTYKNDMLNGLAQKFDIDGTPGYQAIFEDDGILSYSYLDKEGKQVPFIPVDKVNGQFKSYYANGKISRECGYSDGVKNGKVTVYYNTGQARTEDAVLYGANNGVSKEYYPDGKLMSESFYVLDNLDGVAKEYYKNGKLKRETAYLNGSNHGPAKYYDQNGKLTKTLLYSYGNLISVKNEN